MLRRLTALAVTVALGLLSRLYPLGWPVYDKSLGDVLYAAAAYLALALALPHRRPTVVAALALAFCLAMECFQATGIPARYADRAVVRWLLGTTFSGHDCFSGRAISVRRSRPDAALDRAANLGR